MKSHRHYKLWVGGRVQGVGFRPFVYRLSIEMNLKGWVNNSAQGVQIHLECSEEVLKFFLKKLYSEKPGPALISAVEVTELPLENYLSFTIKESEHAKGEILVQVPSDIRTCPDCFSDIHDPSNRRYRYPFTNCTNCGPRFSIINRVPYDRPQTTMSEFQMCDQCQDEYQNPLDRRFHAQPNACPQCGPHIRLLTKEGRLVSEGDSALKEVGQLLLKGNIIALKGLGGYQLLCDARQVSVIKRLRQLKNRKTKPFAVMVRNSSEAFEISSPTDSENSILSSPQAPIVLILKKSVLPEELAPNNPYLGVMLPTTGLHDLILNEVQGPLVVTSGNLLEEPICIDDQDAQKRLQHICDYFLVHNRKIQRPLDDSLVRVIQGQPVIIRKARGYTPDFISTSKADSAICLGGQLKSSFTIVHENYIIQSQYLGDLDNELSFDVYKSEIAKYLNFYNVNPERVFCDSHPQYQSSLYADKFQLPKVPVQHHLAHIFSVMCEHQLHSSVVGISWDGSGYGKSNHEMWGGEFYDIDSKLNKNRFGSLYPLPLLGGEKSYIEVERLGVGLCFEIGHQPETERERELYQIFLNKDLHQKSTSVGRLLEGISSLLDLCHRNTFEGEAAQKLEFEAMNSNTEDYIELPILQENDLNIIDWRPLIAFVRENKGRSVSDKARIVHQSLVRASVEMVCTRQYCPDLVLAGGCFQNKILVETFVKMAKSHQVHFSQKSPPNDGGICLGQAFFATKFQGHPVK